MIMIREHVVHACGDKMNTLSTITHILKSSSIFMILESVVHILGERLRESEYPKSTARLQGIFELFFFA